MLRSEIIEIVENAIYAGDVRVEFSYSNVNKNKVALRSVRPTEIHDSYFIGVDSDVNDYRRFTFDNMSDVQFDY